MSAPVTEQQETPEPSEQPPTWSRRARCREPGHLWGICTTAPRNNLQTAGDRTGPNPPGGPAGRIRPSARPERDSTRQVRRCARSCRGPTGERAPHSRRGSPRQACPVGPAVRRRPGPRRRGGRPRTRGRGPGGGRGRPAPVQGRPGPCAPGRPDRRLQPRAGHETLRNEVARAQRVGHPFTLAFLDVDGLKALNDSHGHAAGDEFLRAVADAIRQKLRSYDPVVRVGGDEFVCGFVDTAIDAARRRVTDMRAALARPTRTARSPPASPSSRPGETLEQLLERGDQRPVPGQASQEGVLMHGGIRSRGRRARAARPSARVPGRARALRGGLGRDATPSGATTSTRSSGSRSRAGRAG